MQIPAVSITSKIGKKKSIIIGNALVSIYIIVLITIPGAVSLTIGNIIFALGYNLKQQAETNLLYDSIFTKGGEGIYSKIDARGASLYYIFDGIASLLTGYLFVVNNYLPIVICLVI